MPSGSVIIPVYNVEKYLGECLDSVLGQTLRDIEVICVDDGSTDGSPAMLEKYAAKDPRVKVLRQENSGAGVARNTGLSVASGDYLFFCDPDDWCDRDMLRVMYGRAVKDRCDVVLAGMIRHNCACAHPSFSYPARKLVGLPGVFPGRDACDFIFVAARANPWNKLFRRAFVKERKIEFQAQKRENDLFFSYVTVALAERIGVVDDAYYHYRMGRTGSLQACGGSDGSPLLWIDAFRAVRARLEQEGVLDVFAFGLLRALLGTGARAVLKLACEGDVRTLYSALRDETVNVAGLVGRRLEELGDVDKAVWGIVSANASPIPLLAFWGRHFRDRASALGSVGDIARKRRSHGFCHVMHRLFGRS